MNAFNTNATPCDADAIVIGAGAVGLAVARALALGGRSVMVLEQHAQIGSETSARNSEVIHAGLYYPTGSLKAQLCVRGNALMYAYCAARGVAHRAVGKLIVAASVAEVPALQALMQKAQANNVPQMQFLSADEARALEPQLQCHAALLSASTGIVSSHDFMLALQGDLEAAGGAVVCHARVLGGALGGELGGGITRLDISTPDGPVQLRTPLLVNCAGLHATQLASKLQGFPKAAIPKPYYAKGSYFTLAAPSPFQRLIYPLPSGGGLGVHLTLDLGGQARFGPDAQWLALTDPSGIDYAVDSARSADFYASIRRYWPALPDGALQPAYSGVRPKIAAENDPAADFMIAGHAQHGMRGVVHLFGIESPGLTASLAIGEYVAGLVA